MFLNRKYNIALIGCGAIYETHIDSIKKIKGCNIAAVCDIDFKKTLIEAQKYKCKAFKDYKEVLKDEDIDAVHILTPHFLHTSIAMDALNAGKYVLLEKPVGISMDELIALKEAEQLSASKIGVVFQNRYNNTSVKMKELIDNGDLGKFIAAKAFVAWHRDEKYYSDSPWRGSLKTEGGGLLINQSIHTLDLLRWLGGEVESLKGYVSNDMHSLIEVEDVASATLYYKNGAVANFYGTNNHGTNSKIELELVFENGVLRMLDDKLYLKANNKAKCIAKDIVRSGKKGYWGLSHTACIKSFYEAIDNNEYPEISVSDAATTNEIVLGIYASSQTNKKYIMTEEQNG